MGKKVPPVLLSGDHAKVDAWRRRQALLRTAARRPDLLERADLSEKERALCEEARISEDISGIRPFL